eukprot:GEMP01023524.1.p1 GENE.GEMP01023524.1~~GEMP01023524.1.p1  ORF type:complete len:224 (+),score=25.90 GEMP01023524.1:117-788(+)
MFSLDSISHPTKLKRSQTLPVFVHSTKCNAFPSEGVTSETIGSTLTSKALATLNTLRLPLLGNTASGSLGPLNDESRDTVGMFALEASPMSFRVSYVTNRSSVASWIPATKNTEVKSMSSTAEDVSETSYGDNNSVDDPSPYPFVKGQRLGVLHEAKMRLRENKQESANPHIADLLVGELVYFLKAGQNGRLKVQDCSGHIGWVSWKHKESGTQILAVNAKEV